MCKLAIKKLFKRKQKIKTDGVLPKIGDPRTIQLSSVIVPENLPPLPTIFNVDSQFPDDFGTPIYANDRHNCCVISSRGHMTLRFEAYEQGIVIPITDQEILTEYFKQSKGQDNGLYMLSSLNAWRQGWIAAGNTYNIYAFAAVNHKDPTEVRAAIYLLKGLYVALNMSASCPDQWYYGNPWTYAPRDSIVFNHAVYIYAYDAQYLYCITWGRIQRMTWEFFHNMCTEAYAVIDDVNSWMDPATDPLSVAKCQQQLDLIKNIPPNTLTNVKVFVVDKNNVPVKDCQVSVYKGSAPQTYAITDKNGVGNFVALRIGEEYLFSASYQAPDKRTTYPVSVTKTLNTADLSTTEFQIKMNFDYPASAAAATLVL